MEKSNIEIIEEVRRKAFEAMPSCIDTLKEIIADKKASPKVIVSASRTLLNMESVYKKMKKEFENGNSKD